MTPHLPRSISVQRYKAFRQRATLELRPLTLLYGYNNTGKSALVRVLRALSESVQPGLPPGLNTQGVLRGARFQDLLWSGPLEAAQRSFEISLTLGSGRLRALRLVFKEDTLHPNRILPFELEATLDDAQTCTLKLADLPYPGEEAYSYTLQRSGEAQTTLLLTWQGLLPTLEPAAPSPPDHPLALIHATLLALRHSVSWLHAVREAPPRFTPISGRRERLISPHGENSTLLLDDDPALCERCAPFLQANLKRHLSTERLDSPTGPVVATWLGTRSDEVIPRKIHLTDSGEGPIHLLPVLVALEQLRSPSAPTSPQLLLLEEPEAHIHPHLQRKLAEHLCALAATLQGRLILMETHSEHILLGVQLQLALRHLTPEQVALHWVAYRDDTSSEVLPVALDQEGRPDGLWPDGVFTEDLQIARLILKARREHEGA